MYMWPLFMALLPPMKQMSLCTAGSAVTMSLNCCCLTRIASKEMSCDA